MPTAVAGLLYWFAPLDLPSKSIPGESLIYAALPLAWLTIGLIRQIIILQKQVDLEPCPNMSMRDAFQHVLLRSKAAIGTDPNDDSFYPNAESIVRDAARLGRLLVWARPLQDFSGGFRQTLSPIASEKWRDLRLDLMSCVYDAQSTARLSDYSKDPWNQFEDVQVISQQVLSLWPKSNWWERWRDPQDGRRLEWFEQERLGQARHTPEPSDDSTENGQEKEMNNRDPAVTNTRNYVLATCGLFGFPEIFLLANLSDYPLLKLPAAAFGMAITIGVVHIGFLYYEDLYAKNASDENVKFLSWRVRGKFSLLMFVSLVGLGLISILLHVLSV